MEPFVQLVKVIFIHSVIGIATSQFIITGNYILEDRVIESTHAKIFRQEYLLFDLQHDLIYEIDKSLNQKVILSRDVYMAQAKEDRAVHFPAEKPLKPKFRNGLLDDFHCKIEEVRMQDVSGYNLGVRYTLVSYYAKIPWLDNVLNTTEKRSYAGFVDSSHTPYHFLLSRYKAYERGSDISEVLTIVEQSEADTSLIRTILNLPISNK